MRFEETPLSGAFVVEIEPRRDERGFFARTFCRETFRSQGLVDDYPQANHSRSHERGTLRGLHFQRAPHAEAKLVRCVRGAIFDVIVDLRAGSPTRLAWHSVVLDAGSERMLYVPEGFAHGFQTLADDTDVIYQVSHPYTPNAEGGLRFDDPALAIPWPETVTAITEKDRSWPLL